MLQANSSANNYLNGVTMNGTLDLTSIANSRERIVNGLTLNGAVNVANGGILTFDSNNTTGGAQTIGGTATINLNDSNAKISIEGNGSTTLGSGVLIQGQGEIGTAIYGGGTNVLTSNGTISANASGGTLTINPPGNSGSFVNNGTLEAQNGGTLVLNTNITNNTGSEIIAGTGSTVLQNGVSLNGILDVAAGSLTASASSNNVFNTVTLTGNLDLTTDANSREQIVNGLTLTGAVNVANGGILTLSDNGTTGNIQSILGNATINLNDSSAKISIEGNGTTTLGANVLIQGQGEIGTAIYGGGNNTLVNNGTITANAGAGTSLTINPPANSGSVTNNSILSAVNGSTLVLASTVNNAGQIDATSAGVVQQVAVSLNAGTINTSGGGVLQANTSGNNFLNGVTLNGTLDLTTITNSRERIVNGLTLNGAINVANGGVLSLDSNDTTGGAQTLGGTATINLNDPSARISIEGNGSTTLGANVLIQGEGEIGNAIYGGGNNALTNNGTITANVAGGTLTLNAPANSGSITNNNVLSASGGGTLALSSSITNTAAGRIEALAGGVVQQLGVSLAGGTLSSAGSGDLQVGTSSNNFLSDVTLAGTLDEATVTNSRERIINGLTLDSATINVANGGVLSLDSNDTSGGSQTIGGTGTISLNDSSARISIEGNGSTTLGAGVVIQGQGEIGNALYGGGNNALTNQGSIIGTGGTLTINPPANSGSFTNNGLVQAASSGTVTVNPVLLGTGTLQVSGTGQLNLSTAGVNNTGVVLANGSNAGSLNVGSQNLIVSGDYNNANFGVGNAFNARANVAGTGLIEAGGNAAQAITGADVTNGSTTTATLTIGNVHVGANNYAYQIANTGTSGPSLRGAIQTSVNGGNITDSRLSGSGVTGSNYDTGGPGSSTAPYDVVFTASSAGALAPLSGQAVNLTSNFANIPNQRLDFALGSGAAAYNLASGSTTPTPVTIANQRVGGANSQVLTVANSAPSGSFTEVLNAGFGSNTGAATNNGGSISGGVGSGVAGGASNSTAMSVGVNSAASGLQTGTVTLNYVSNGTGTSGLGNTGVGSQTITVSGGVYQAAAGAINTAPLSFGVVQVGQAVSQTLSISNIATGPSGYVEDLNASFGSTSGTGASLISGAGSINELTAGSVDSTHMTVSVNTSSAGTVNGAIGVNFYTAGTVNGESDGLGVAGVGSASYGVSGTIQTTGTVINDADPVINNSPINLGNTHVGATSPVGLVSLTNQATTAPQASLNASITGNTPITASGTVTDLAPGATDATHLQVGMNTGTAGAISGTATLGLVSDAGPAGCTSNCLLTLASQNVTVTGGVYQYAQPTVASSVNLGNVRVGSTVEGAFAVANTNIAPAGYQEGLDAAYVGGSGTNGASAFGTITNLAAGSASELGASLTAGGAGAQSGTVTIGLTSDGTIDGLSSTTLASQNVTVQATGYRLANPLLAPTAITLNARVGDAAPSTALTVTNSSVDAYTEGLAATLSAATGPFTNNGGAITNLTANAMDSSTLKVGMSTGTSGTFTGTQTVNFTSNGIIDNASAVSVGTGTVHLTGNVYTTAVANVTPTGVNFGIVHVGDTVGTQALTVTNAAAGALNDVLTGGFASVTGPFTGGGSLAGLAAGSMDSSTLQLGMNTSTAGTYSGTATLGLLSHDGALSDVAAVNGSTEVDLTGQVNYHATPTFELSGSGNTGTLTGSGDAFTLNLGTVRSGESLTDLIEFLNGAPGQADALGGSFTDAGTAPGLMLEGFTAVSGLLDGQGETGEAQLNTLGLAAGTSFTDVLSFEGTGSNASGFSEDLTASLTITGEIGSTTTPVPEPDTLLLWLGAGGLLLLIRRVRSARALPRRL